MNWEIRQGDVLARLRETPDESVNCCVSSPPYFGLRSYLPKGHPDKHLEIGTEATPELYLEKIVKVFREVRRVLRSDGTCWINIGDSYCSTDKWGGGVGGNTGKCTVADDGSVPSWAVRKKREPFPGVKPKDLIGVPWMLAFALRADGWYLRSEIIWHKPNPMPESVTDRPTKAHEQLFLLTKNPRYIYDAEAIAEPAAYIVAESAKPSGDYSQDSGRNDGNQHRSGGFRAVKETRNKRSVWTINGGSGSQAAGTSRRECVSWDEAGDDSERIPSLNCPLHGGSFGSVSSAFYDGLRRGNSTRNGRTSVHPDQELLIGRAPTDPRRADYSVDENSDWSDQLHESTATFRNSQMNKTDLDLETNRPCMPSAQNRANTGRTEDARESCDSAGRKTESSSEEGFFQDASHLNPSEQTPIHIEGSCTCTYYRTISDKKSHFATFPIELPETCILAGCPVDGLVLDPFAGAGTTGLAALKHGRSFLGIELNPAYIEIANNRVGRHCPLLVEGIA